MNRSSFDRLLMAGLCAVTAPTVRSRAPLPDLYRARILRGSLRGKVLHLPALERPAFLLGTFESHVVRALERHLRPGAVAYDVGAYVGYLAMVMSKLAGVGGEVVAFEANPTVTPALRANVGTAEFSNVRVVQAGVAERSANLTFATFDYSTVGHIANADTPGDAVMVDVPAVTLDEFVFARGGRIPDLVKIDVNGGEVDVLRGATRVLATRPPTVIVEVRTRTRADVIDLLRSAGYAHTALQATRQSRADLYNLVFTPPS